jgi:hypothetical protein
MVNMAKLVWAFHIEKPKGCVLDESVETGYEGGFLICPKHFPLKLTVRSQEHLDVVQSELVSAQQVLSAFRD